MPPAVRVPNHLWPYGACLSSSSSRRHVLHLKRRNRFVDSAYNQILMVTRRTLLGAAGERIIRPDGISSAEDPLGMIGLAPGTHFSDILSPLNRLPDVEVVAIAEPQTELIERAKKNPRARRSQGLFGCEASCSTPRNSTLSASATPRASERPQSIECAATKLNVIAEKPLAISREEQTRIRKAIDSPA